MMSTQTPIRPNSPVTTPIDEDSAWEQLVARDRSADFLYAVTTTGVFCRPGCGSRPPLRRNTQFFSTADEARSAGFRACQRCRPEDPEKPSTVAQMCARLEQKIDRAVPLAELGKLTGMSPFTAQRLFKATMGVTPSQYQRAIRAAGLRSQLQAGASVTDAIYEAGYGSSSRAYEQAPLGMTPGRFLAGGRGEEIGFAVAPFPVLDGTLLDGPTGEERSWIIVASTERGLCWLAMGASAAALEAGLREEFPAANISPKPELASTIETVLKQVQQAPHAPQLALPLDLRGTAFQLRVWQALQQIPSGETRSYSQLASDMGNPASTRAVARACALNRVSILVPCHRVVGVSGSLTGYRWGIERKRRLLALERS